MFKSAKSSPQPSMKKINNGEEEYIIEKIVRIDGNETVRKYKKAQLLGRGGFANCFVTENLETKKKAATKII